PERAHEIDRAVDDESRARHEQQADGERLEMIAEPGRQRLGRQTVLPLQEKAAVQGKRQRDQLPADRHYDDAEDDGRWAAERSREEPGDTRGAIRQPRGSPGREERD